MRITLRLIAILSAVSVLATVWFIVWFGTRGLSALMNSGLLGAITFVGWAVTLVAGPIAAVQLFRLRTSGRIAAIILFSTALAYYAVGLAGLRTADAPVAPLISAVVFLAAIVVVLLSPRARDACVVGEVRSKLHGG